MRAATGAFGVLLLATAGCGRDPERADAAARAVVPGIETAVAHVETLRDAVDGFGRVAAEAEPPEVRDARTQLVDLEARRRLAAQQVQRLEALGQAVAPRKELDAARAEEASAAAAAVRARAMLNAFGEPTSGEPLAADERWVIVRVPQSDTGRVASGAPCRLVADAFPDRPLAGTLDAAVSYVDPDTGTAPVRMRVRDPDRVLRPGMTGAVTIDVGPPRQGVVVPAGAVLYDGAEAVVFLAEGEGRYARHPVGLGASLDGWVEVTGVNAGARVVTAGGASLLSANRLAAGGAEED